jgi:hypothetical protein
MWWLPQPRAPGIAGVVTVTNGDGDPLDPPSGGLAYSTSPDPSGNGWVVRRLPPQGFESWPNEGIGCVAVPALVRGGDGAGTATEIAVANTAPAPGTTHALTLIFDQNGPVSSVCHRLGQGEAGYVDLAALGFLGPGFRGGALVSATSWDHRQYDDAGFFRRNDVSLAAAAVTLPRRSTGLSGSADRATGLRGIPLRPIEPDTLTAFAGGAAAQCTEEHYYPFHVGGCGPIEFDSCADCPLELPAFGVVRTSVIDLAPPDCPIEDLDVLLDIEHPYPSDLTVKLTNGRTTRTLLSGACAEGEGIRLVLDDEADEPIGAVCPLPSGQHVTTSSGEGLQSFYGARAGGKWTLVIEDRFPYHAGTLNDFELRFRFPP